MRALDILHTRLTDAMEFMHSARWRALWLITQAVITGEQLWLTALGRSRPGSAQVKHGIKAVDRLLGNRPLFADRRLVYRGLASLIIPPGSRPVLLVDVVEIRPRWFALVASVPFSGRSFVVYACVSRCCKPKRAAIVRFLRDLGQILPSSRPVLVTDAGFETPWFDAVADVGWDFVGRVRNSTKMLIDGKWVGNKEVHRRATNRPQNLGRVAFPRSKPTERRMVLAKKPQRGHRRRLTRGGRISNKRVDHEQRQNAREPWLLATSLTARPSIVVEIFARRMRIEQTFRDVKNFRWGWSLRHCGSRSRQRLELLLLVGALALLVQQIVGRAAENLELAREHQANTERRRRVLSIFVLGGLVLRRADVDRVPAASVTVALWQLRNSTGQFDRGDR